MEDNKYSLFIGRWQPFHLGHKFIVDRVLSQGKKVCIGIRDTSISDSNPYSFEQREEMIKRVYSQEFASGFLKIIKLPDIESVNIGREVGYDVNYIETPEEISGIRGSEIRSGFYDSVPIEVKEYMLSLPQTIWFTGLSCAGKTTLGLRLKGEFERIGRKVVHLDADDLRNGINSDLGYSEKDRFENLRRVSHIARILNQNGVDVIASFIAPTNYMRQNILKIIGNMKFVYVKCSLSECERRDVKGMYKKARQNIIKDFTGISSLFEEPDGMADIVLDSEKNDVESCIKEVMSKIGFNQL